jgi:hypothetical protein
MASNPLELHHRLGVEVAPDKSLQLTPRVKNNTAGVIVEEFKKGNLSKSEVEKQLKKIIYDLQSNIKNHILIQILFYSSTHQF